MPVFFVLDVIDAVHPISGVAKLRLFELSEKLYICFLFFISIAKCRNVVKWYCGS